MEETIKTAVRIAIENGSRKLRVTFKNDARHGLYSILALVNNGMLKVSSGELSIAYAVLEAGDWSSDANRSFTVELTELFQEKPFVAVMALFLEKIAYAKPKHIA